MMKIFCFYLIKEKISRSEFPGLNSEYITPINGKEIALYAFTPNRSVANDFIKSRNKKLFFQKTVEMSKADYEEFCDEYKDCLLEPHTYNTKVLVDGKYHTKMLMMYSTLNESDCIIFYKEEYVMRYISDILDDNYFNALKGRVFKKKIKSVLDNIFLYDSIVTKIEPMEDINYDNFIVDDIALYIKLFLNTFKEKRR